VFGWTPDETESFAVLDAYRAAGGNFVDTADELRALDEASA
jgi:aryl-alcohol dehydrogenase-like predicted oxidoreductase